MYMSLLTLGFAVTAAGVAMVGFGIPNNEFGLGNTLIMAGTTAIVGGLILVGVADAVRQLRRIAESLMARPSPRMSRPIDQFEPPAPGGLRHGPGPGRIPFPPKPTMEGRGRGPTPFEQRLAATPSLEDETPLSPQAPTQESMQPRGGMADVVPEPRDTDLAAGLLTAEMLRLDVSLRPAPPSETPPQSGLFDSLWPADTRSSKAPEVEPVRDEPTAEEESVQEADEKEEAPAEPHAVSILKSGVVDGMAYTLYSDGSIEAELPQGTVRFASITELRDYLDRSS